MDNVNVYTIQPQTPRCTTLTNHRIVLRSKRAYARWSLGDGKFAERPLAGEVARQQARATAAATRRAAIPAPVRLFQIKHVDCTVIRRHHHRRRLMIEVDAINFGLIRAASQLGHLRTAPGVENAYQRAPIAGRRQPGALQVQRNTADGRLVRNNLVRRLLRVGQIDDLHVPGTAPRKGEQRFGAVRAEHTQALRVFGRFEHVQLGRRLREGVHLDDAF